MSMPASITAITFVALGTSLPDTFASKSAATQDPHADASVGNVTGSNSVNVFLGLGLPWMMASIFWWSKGSTPTDQWTKYVRRVAGLEDSARTALIDAGQAFVVPAGNL